MKHIILCAMPLVGCIALGACKHSAPKSPTAGAVANPPHAVQGEQLRDVMHKMAERVAYSPTSKLPPDPESNKTVDPKVFDEIAELASQLSASSLQIPDRAKNRAMSGEERQAFEAEASTLRGHAVELEHAARAHKIEQVQRAYDAVNGTCINCHSRFRDFAGELEFRKAAATTDDVLARGLR